MTGDFPGLSVYALAHRCTTCGAAPGVPCTAPNKWPGVAHAARQDAGYRHYRRDVGKAPWPEDRVPGQRYDTLPREVTS